MRLAHALPDEDVRPVGERQLVPAGGVRVGREQRAHLVEDGRALPLRQGGDEADRRDPVDDAGPRQRVDVPEVRLLEGRNRSRAPSNAARQSPRR